MCWLSQALARSCVNTLAKQPLAGSGPERARDSAARCEAQPWALLNAPSAAAPAPAQLTRRAGALLCQPAVSSARGRRWRVPNAAAVPPGSRRDPRPALGAKLGRVHADVGAAAGPACGGGAKRARCTSPKRRNYVSPRRRIMGDRLGSTLPSTSCGNFSLKACADALRRETRSLTTPAACAVRFDAHQNRWAHGTPTARAWAQKDAAQSLVLACDRPRKW